MDIAAGMSQVVKNEKDWDLLPYYMKDGESALVNLNGTIIQDDNDGTTCTYAGTLVKDTYPVAMGTVSI